MKNDTESCIKEIVAEIPAGCIFDSHFVIGEIIKRYSDAYRFASDDESTAQMHGRIAQMIGRCQHVDKFTDDESWSNTIHGKPSQCALWKRK